MYYDGIQRRGGARFRFYPLSNTVDAMNGYDLSVALYEVGEQRPLTCFQQEDQDWAEIFYASNSYMSCMDSNDNSDSSSISVRNASDRKESKPNEGMADRSNMSSQLSELSESISSPKKKTNVKRKRMSAKKESNKTPPAKQPTTSQQTTRIPQGFSIRRKVPTRGQHATCKGCGKRINYEDKCMRYKYKEKENHLWFATDQYHCMVDCIRNMPPGHKDLFLKKKWTDKTMKDIVTALQSQ